MRPVIRGPWPKDGDGNDIRYTDYATARAELISRLGECCSYCEMHLNTSLAVEHVQPKNPKGVSSPIRERELDWNNFLLACTNCNSTKGAKDVELTPKSCKRPLAEYARHRTCSCSILPQLSGNAADSAKGRSRRVSQFRIFGCRHFDDQQNTP